jgi:hypothetical protein
MAKTQVNAGGWRGVAGGVQGRTHGDARLAEALNRKRAKAAGTRMFLVHQAPKAGTPTAAVALGVRALPWQEFLDNL